MVEHPSFDVRRQFAGATTFDKLWGFFSGIQIVAVIIIKKIVVVRMIGDALLGTLAEPCLAQVGDLVLGSPQVALEERDLLLCRADLSLRLGERRQNICNAGGDGLLHRVGDATEIAHSIQDAIAEMGNRAEGPRLLARKVRNIVYGSTCFGQGRIGNHVVGAGFYIHVPFPHRDFEPGPGMGWDSLVLDRRGADPRDTDLRCGHEGAVPCPPPFEGGTGSVCQVLREGGLWGEETVVRAETLRRGAGFATLPVLEAGGFQSASKRSHRDVCRIPVFSYLVRSGLHGLVLLSSEPSGLAGVI